MGGKLVAVLVSVALVCASSGVIDAGPSGGALPPQLIQVLEVAGDHGVPDDAEMVAVNVAAVTPATAGHLTVYPCDHDVPTTSNLNYLADDVVPNFALVRVADDGTICIATHAVADLVVDVVGYVPAGSSITALDAPVRVTDTRAGAPVQAGNLRVVDLSEVVEPDATMAMFNLTSVRAEARGHATVFPCTADVPSTSSLNYERRRTVANFVVARLSSDRSVCVYSHATSDFVIDVVASTADGIVTLDRPVRVRDTREQGAPIGAGDTLELDLVRLGGVPDDATAAVYNLTAASASARGHATSYPCDGDRPEASNLNYRPGRSSANSTITKLSASGRLCIDVHAATHLVVDLIGYTTDDTHYVPLTPTRALDTRTGWRPRCDQTLIGLEAEPPEAGDHAVWYSAWYLVADDEMTRLDLPAVTYHDVWWASLLSDCTGAALVTDEAVHLAPADGGPRLTEDLHSFGNPMEIVDGNVVMTEVCCPDDYHVVDAQTGEPILTLDSIHLGGASVDWSGRYIAVAFDSTPGGRANDETLVYDAATDELVAAFTTPFDITPTISPSGEYIAWPTTKPPEYTQSTVITTFSGDHVSTLDLRFDGWSGRGTLHGQEQVGSWRMVDVSIFGDVIATYDVPRESADRHGLHRSRFRYIDRR